MRKITYLIAAIFAVIISLGVGYVVIKYRHTSQEEYTILPAAPTETQKEESIPYQTDSNEKIISDLKNSGLVCETPGDETEYGCTVDVVLENFAKGKMPMAYWIAERGDGGTWKPVITGNGIPTCEQVELFAVPEEVYGNCIESSGELRF